MYWIYCTEKKNKKNCLSLRYNKKTSHLFINGTEIKFKSKNTEIITYRLCLKTFQKTG